MTYLEAAFKLYEVITLLTAVTLVSGHQWNPRQQMMYAAENRALQGFGYARRSACSRVSCGLDCNRDERCKSFNFDNGNKTCELNLATRREHPGAFCVTPGSVYFDADKDTPYHSLTDISLNRYRSCKTLLEAGYCSSGVYTIYPRGFDDDGLRVYCDMETDGGGWIVFQRRQDGSVDFYRNWTDYQSGFGELTGEFWLGNDNLVTLTSDDSQGTWELRVDLGDWEGNTAWAKYSDFKISPGEYTLNIGQYDSSSTGRDALGYSRGRAFTTKDNDNDGANSNCAQIRKGAWWFWSCAWAHLNGHYYHKGSPVHGWGVSWHYWRASPYSLKTCSMKMRETYP